MELLLYTEPAIDYDFRYSTTDSTELKKGSVRIKIHNMQVEGTIYGKNDVGIRRIWMHLQTSSKLLVRPTSTMAAHIA